MEQGFVDEGDHAIRLDHGRFDVPRPREARILPGFFQTFNEDLREAPRAPGVLCARSSARSPEEARQGGPSRAHAPTST